MDAKRLPFIWAWRKGLVELWEKGRSAKIDAKLDIQIYARYRGSHLDKMLAC